MQRRNFLKACVATVLAPATLVKAKAAPQPPNDAALTLPFKGKIPEKTIWGEPKLLMWDHEKCLWCKVPGLQEIELFPHQEEALEEISNWGVDEIDEETRKEILLSGWTAHEFEMDDGSAGVAILDNRRILEAEF